MGSASNGPRRAQRRGPLIGLLLAALASAGLLAYFGSRSVGGRAASNAGTAESDAAAHPSGSPERRAADAPPGPAHPLAPAPAGSVTVPHTREEIEAYRGPAGEVDTNVRDKGIDALLDGEPCIRPSKLVEKGRQGPGGVGCRIEATGDTPPVMVKRWVFRNPSGLLEVGDFANGMREGVWKQYYPSGYPASEGEFVADQRDGIWHEWDETGRYVARRSYKNGRFDGVSVVFAGAEPRVEVWVDGRLPAREGEEDAAGPHP